MNLKPLYDRVVILPQKKEEISSSGIILPLIKDEKSDVGVVVCTGDGQTFDGQKVEMQVKPNDKVLYSKYGAVSYSSEDKTYLILRQADILAIIKGE